LGSCTHLDDIGRRVVADGNKTQQVRDYFQAKELPFDLSSFDSFGDNYTVVWASSLPAPLPEWTTKTSRPGEEYIIPLLN
jgi:hypothetical protein